MKEILPDVYCLEGSVNIYFFVEKDGLTVVDAGMPGSDKKVLNAIQELGHQPEDVKRILVTHSDLDHVGGLAAIQAATGAAVITSAEAADHFENGRFPQHLPPPMQWFAITFFKTRPVPQTCIQLCQDGDELPLLGGLQVISTPGHTPDHHSFYSPALGLLFAGDALRTENGRLSSSPKRITANQEQAAQSAIRLLELTPAIFACGHGEPMQNHSSDDIMMLFNELRQ
jgi:glyoxylase-like metal-dependent hydrolase (beta-lactamase superfamily II)